jgi:hypothetical protein
VSFKVSDLFSGPSQYFHLKTLATLTKHRSAVDAFHDDTYLDALYATLTAWGLHRMGPGNTKLRDIEEIRRNLILNTERIRALEQLRLSTVPIHETERVAERIWAVLRSLKVSRAKALLVANSKALHHVLPALVPPIDREYTLQFFFATKSVDGREEEAFRVMFPHFCQLARSQKSVLEKYLRAGGWNSSETKVIDNAIVGYLRPPNNPLQRTGHARRAPGR